MSGSPGRRPGWRREAVAFLELAALTGFAVAQPVFHLLSGAADYLAFNRVGGADLVALAAALVVVPPTVLWVVGFGARLVRPRAGEAVHGVAVGGLLVIVALQALRSVPFLEERGRLLGAVALGLGLGLGLVYVRWRPARLWARLASPAPVVFALLFLFASPVSGLVRTVGAAPPPGASGDRAAPVVLVVFDELPVRTLLGPDGGIDGRLFPNFAALAAESTFFRNATTVAARTMHAVPAILTGRFPQQDLAPTSAGYPENLFSLLRSSHEVHAYESVAALCPPSVCPADDRVTRGRWSLVGDAARLWAHAVAPGVPTGDPLGDWFWEEVDEAAGRPARFTRFLASIDGRGTPFHFLHVLLPHAPWRYLPDGEQYVPRNLGLVSYDQRTDERWPALVDHQRHLLQTAYVDTLLGQIVSRLREVGLYDRASIVITADHGMSFEAGLARGTRTFLPENEHDIAWVPLLVKAPGQTRGSVRDDNAMTVDIAPTVAELAGTAIPWEVDGISLASSPPRGPTKILHNEPGQPISFDGAGYERVLSGAAAEVGRPGEGVPGMFVVGPYGDLVGADAAALAVAGGPAAAVGTVVDAGAFDDVDLAGGVVPALVVGHLDDPPELGAGAGVAIVVNGTVAAVSELYPEGDQDHRFAGMVWPGWLHQGANVLELYLVEGDTLALRPVSIAGP